MTLYERGCPYNLSPAAGTCHEMRSIKAMAAAAYGKHFEEVLCYIQNCSILKVQKRNGNQRL